MTSAPAAVSWGPGRIDVFIPRGHDALLHKYFDGKWSAVQARRCIGDGVFGPRRHGVVPTGVGELGPVDLAPREPWQYKTWSLARPDRVGLRDEAVQRGGETERRELCGELRVVMAAKADDFGPRPGDLRTHAGQR